MKTKCKVVAIPTEEVTQLVYNHKTYLFFIKMRMQMVKKTITFHLYIVSDDEIKEGHLCLVDNRNNRFEEENYSIEVCHNKVGDWIYSNNENGIGHNPDWTKKVIATTDPYLNLPLIPERFIKEYCDANGIEEVMCEVSDNTVSISPLKESWSRE